MNKKSYLSVVLHGHLPFVFHPEYAKFLEEDWFFEAMCEVYIPLFHSFGSLYEEHGLKANITVSLSPSLIAMMENKRLIEKLAIYIKDRLIFLEEEIYRYSYYDNNDNYLQTAVYYKDFYMTVRSVFKDNFNSNILGYIKRLIDNSVIEVITTSATHTFLPNFLPFPEYVRFQQIVGIKEIKRVFNTECRGFWLPECGYYPSVERGLMEGGIKYSILEAHGVLTGSPVPIYGSYAPVYSSSGFAFFPRDIDSAKSVWSRQMGYPADTNYRDFYKDVGFEWDTLYTGKLLHRDENGNVVKGFTGIKYWKIEEQNGKKMNYNPYRAKEKTAEHAKHFINSKIEKTQLIAGNMDKPPLFLAPYDMELFGHWWFEGPDFIKNLVLECSKNEDIEMITLSNYLRRHPVHQEIAPAYSSWGEKGFSEVWNNEKTQRLIIESHKRVDKFLQIIGSVLKNKKDIKPLQRKVVIQLAKELLLLTSSDWPFLINSDIAGYSGNRFKAHAENFDALFDMLSTNKYDRLFVENLEFKNQVFPELDIKDLEILL